MEVSISAADHKQYRDNITTDNDNLENHVLHDPEFDDEGSLWYRKQRRK